MDTIKIGKNGEDDVCLMIPFSIADILRIDDGDQVKVKREDEYLYIYKLWGMDEENGYNVCKKNNGMGLVVRSRDLKYYFQYGQEYEMDTEPMYDDKMEKDLFELTKI
jgi:hypothetical protein